MLTGKLRNQVDKIWEAFWTSGIQWGDHGAAANEDQLIGTAI